MGAGESRESDADSTRTSIESQSAGDASSLRSIEVEVPAPADEDSNKAVLVGTLPFPPASTLPAPNPLRTIMSGEALPAESTRRTPNSTEPSPSLKSVAAAPPANAAASKLGAALKGGKLRRDLMAVMGRAAADPKIEVSVEHAEALMPHDEQGRMLPLGCPLGCFQVFGSGVFVYMALFEHFPPPPQGLCEKHRRLAHLRYALACTGGLVFVVLSEAAEDWTMATFLAADTR